MTSSTSINKFSNNNKPFSTHTGSLQTHPILPYSSVKQWNSTGWEHRSLATDVQLWYGQLSSVILNMSELFVLSVCIGFSNHVKNSKKIWKQKSINNGVFLILAHAQFKNYIVSIVFKNPSACFTNTNYIMLHSLISLRYTLPYRQYAVVCVDM